MSTSVVKLNGAAKTTTFVSATQLTGPSLPLISSRPVRQLWPSRILRPAAAHPAIYRSPLARFSANADFYRAGFLYGGGSSVHVYFTGTGFVAGATANFGASPVITPSSVTTTQIVATIPAADISTAGTVNVTVTNRRAVARQRSDFHHQQSCPDGNLPLPNECHCRRRRLHSHRQLHGASLHML